MNATQELIAKLVAGGMEFAAAAGLVARAAVEMTGALTKKSAGAQRQQRYRDRHKASLTVTRNDDESVTKRNETSQRDDGLDASQSVTNRNESVTSDTAPFSIEEKKESKKVKRESRASQLPDNWRPDAKAWAEAVEILGSEERAIHELRKFALHAADKGRLAKNWNAAFVKWCLQAIEYGARNGTGGNNRTNTAAGRATARDDSFLAAVGGGALNHLGKANAAGPERQISGGLDFADRADAGGEPEGRARAPYRIVG